MGLRLTEPCVMGCACGDRVGAVESANMDEVYLLGYGRYMGEEIPPPEISLAGLLLSSLGHATSKILLDNGKIVWGCECWWGAEAKVKASIGQRRVREVSVEQIRWSLWREKKLPRNLAGQ